MAIMPKEPRDDRVDPDVTGAQIRGARGLLNMSVADLSERTGLAVNTIRKAEKTNALPDVTTGNLRLIVSTLEQAGVIFLPAETLGAGVRLRDPTQAPLRRRRD
jgi:transcriptional regulator with XRE-family HTH domain